MANGETDRWSECECNVCRCTGGEATRCTACPDETVETCAWCHRGRHMINGRCEQNVCTCPNGEPATGILCITHGSEICAPKVVINEIGDASSKERLCGSIGRCPEFIEQFVNDNKKMELWTPSATLTEPCSHSPLVVPYVVCFRHVTPEAYCSKWYGVIGDTGSNVRVRAISEATLSVGILEDDFAYFRDDGGGKPGAVAECQKGSLMLRDVDHYTLNATLLHLGCGWERKDKLVLASATTGLDIVAGKCDTLPALPGCSRSDLLRNAASEPGRWMARDAAASSFWAQRVFNRGQDCIQDRGGPNFTDRYCYDGGKCGMFERNLHKAMAWLPWSCELIPSYPEVRTCFAHYLHKKAKLRPKDPIDFMNGYFIGESHIRLMKEWFHVADNKVLTHQVLWSDVCDFPFPDTPNAAFIILAIGNWEPAFPERRPLADTASCLDDMAAHLAVYQSAGIEVRIGTPMAYCCRRGYEDPFTNKSFTRKNTALVARAIRQAAAKYKIPVWDLWQISNGMEEDTVRDSCNHYNSEIYHVGLQVLCNTIPGLQPPPLNVGKEKEK
eukprot:gnl/TRDRNA2_/TRDRNA2_176745_c0_seq4.p1 gnl/TRDRNA2_/TRDRNA2_176745_c0~~gnl/TRDRNA2_/TRDRNA2_176745_c0_seq4.p1  ORF type:complete len:600 (+),score=36.23 gnl/TRDRNA2_/TRDRNA2_176745_c0_seq4:130-1800(+)